MDKAFASSYKGLQDRHWWFQGRARVLRSLLTGLAWPATPTVLEVGVGPGHGLGEIYPRGVRLIGLEVDENLAREAQMVSGVPVYHGTLDAPPPAVRSARIDVAAMFDVLEHIEDDGRALRQVRALLSPGGLLLLTVPAYQWMWGRQDDVNHHYRRYRWRALRAKLIEAGFAPVRTTYFNTLLFVPIALFRVVASVRRSPRTEDPSQESGQSDFDVSLGWLDPFLARIFSLEAMVIPHLRFPFGVSLFAAARKI